MTTTVTVSAHCADNIEVKITILGITPELKFEEITIQNGESVERCVYDDRAIVVREVFKGE